MTTYRQYSEFPDAERERLFQEWCRKQGRLPTEDGIGDDFLDDYCVEVIGVKDE